MIYMGVKAHEANKEMCSHGVRTDRDVLMEKSAHEGLKTQREETPVLYCSTL